MAPVWTYCAEPIDSLLQVAESGISKEAALAYKELARRCDTKDLDLHLSYAHKAMFVARAIDDALLEGNIYMNIGVFYDINDQFEAAIAHYDSAHAIFVKLNDVDDWLASIHLNYGSAYYYANLKSLALEHWLEAYNKCEKNTKNAEYSLILNNIASIYEELEKYEDAIKYFELSLGLKKERGDTIAYLTTLLNLGRVHSLNHKPDVALGFLEETKVGFAALGRELDVQNVEIYKAIALLENKEFTKASKIIIPLMDSGLPRHQSSRRIEGYLVAGDVCSAQDKYVKALEYYDSAQQIITYSGVTFDQEKLYEKSSKVHFALGNPSKAYQLIRAKVDEMTITMQRDRLLLEQESQVKFNTLQKEQENLVLKNDNTIKDLQIAKTNRNLLLAIVFLLLISVFAAQVYLNRQKIHRLNQSLAVQKEVISKSLKEKEVLLKEIHHRVKNNLQVVSSLLGIQSRRVQDVAAIDALKEGRSRVQSMSLIHQNLYSEDNLTGIEMRSYFRKLAESIFQTYNLSPDAIQLNSDIDELILDVDTVIPLGLILNELISNALKYAFPKGEGTIHVEIKENQEGLYLTVKDNGVGILNPEEINESDSFGYDLINSFVEKLDGSLTVKANNGTEVNAFFKTYKRLPKKIA